MTLTRTGLVAAANNTEAPDLAPLRVPDVRRLLRVMLRPHSRAPRFVLRRLDWDT